MIVHLSPKGASGLPTELEGYELRVALSDHLIAERIIRNSVEKRIMLALLVPAADARGGGRLAEAPPRLVPGLALQDGRTGLRLVGFSKSSAIISSNRLSALVSRARRTRILRWSRRAPSETIVAKFSKDGLVFRLDVARQPGHIPQTLGCILSNDSFAVGYPESLRVAHHLSVFSRSEDMALKAYLTKRYSLKHLRSFGLRRHDARRPEQLRVRWEMRIFRKEGPNIFVVASPQRGREAGGLSYGH